MSFNQDTHSQMFDSYERKRRMRILGVVVLVILLLVVYQWGNGRREDIRCSKFFTQPEAQSLFEQNPLHYRALDGDHDGRACEELPQK